MRPERMGNGTVEEVTVGNRRYRKFIEEDRAKKLWEQTHKEEKRPVDKRRAITEGILIMSLVWSGILTYALAMEAWTRRNENIWTGQMIQTDMQEIGQLGDRVHQIEGHYLDIGK